MGISIIYCMLSTERDTPRAAKSGSRKRECQRGREWCCLSPDKRASCSTRLQWKEGMKRDLGANTRVDIPRQTPRGTFMVRTGARVKSVTPNVNGGE